jgi:hypothetical protein
MYNVARQYIRLTRIDMVISLVMWADSSNSLSVGCELVLLLVGVLVVFLIILLIFVLVLW